MISTEHTKIFVFYFGLGGHKQHYSETTSYSVFRVIPSSAEWGIFSAWNQTVVSHMQHKCSMQSANANLLFSGKVTEALLPEKILMKIISSYTQ